MVVWKLPPDIRSSIIAGIIYDLVSRRQTLDP